MIRRPFAPVLSALLLATFAVGGVACDVDRGVAFTVGDQLSVAEQATIEAAIAEIAQILDDEMTGDDSLMADFALVAARLVRLQGRASELLISSSSPVPDTMRAIGVRGTDNLLGITVDFVLAWKGLDTESFTVERAVLIEKGAIQTATATFREVAPGSAFQVVRGTGSLTFTDPSFPVPCTGLPSSAEGTCVAGRLDAAATLDSTAPSYLYGEFPSTELVGFQVVVR